MAELVKVTLAKDWSRHKEGSTVTVDAVRAAWLKDNRYLEEVEKKRGRVSKQKTD